jgi:hypothetical protein
MQHWKILRKRSINTILRLFAIILLVGKVSFAQNPARSKGENAAVEQADPWQRRLPNFSVQGSLPLEEIRKELARHFREINFVMPPDVANMVISNMDLRSVSLEEIFSAIEIVTKGQVTASRVGERMVSFSSPTRVKPVVRAISISDYLLYRRTEEEQQKALAELEDALQKCWEMQNINNPPRLNFHRATRMLIVQGQPEEVALVQELVGQLQSATPVGTHPSQPSPVEKTTQQ